MGCVYIIKKTGRKCGFKINDNGDRCGKHGGLTKRQCNPNNYDKPGKSRIQRFNNNYNYDQPGKTGYRTTFGTFAHYGKKSSIAQKDIERYVKINIPHDIIFHISAKRMNKYFISTRRLPQKGVKIGYNPQGNYHFFDM